MMKRVTCQPITKPNTRRSDIMKMFTQVELGFLYSYGFGSVWVTVRTSGFIFGMGLGGIALAASLQSITSSARDFRTFFIGGRC